MLEICLRQQLGDFCLQLDISIPAQGVTAIFGVSGAGKTSLINVISGLTKPQYGRITLNERVLLDTDAKIFLPPEKRHIGYVFQDARLFPHYRVKSNLCYGITPSMRAQFDSVVTILGLMPLLDRFPATLSGGEKQRVAIGRALLTEPELLLLDEPLASLDAPRKRELLPYLERIAQEIKIPILYVSHSLDEIVRLADGVVVLDGGQVKVHGPLESVWASSILRPWLQETAQCSVLTVRAVAHHPDYAMSELQLAGHSLWVNRVTVPLGSWLRIRIHAADISLALQAPKSSSIRNILPVQIIELFENNRCVEVKLALGKQVLWAQITPWARDELALCLGMQLYAQIKSISLSREWSI